MQLLLVRHAVAALRDRQRWPDDALRPLTARGKRRFRRAAAGVERLGVPPDVCLASPFRRAAQTAAILHERAGWPEPEPLAWLAPGRSMERLLSDLAARQVARVGLVGHQPGLSRLLSWLISGDASATRIEFRKGSIACVDCGAMPARGRGELRWLLTPRALRTLDTGH